MTGALVGLGLLFLVIVFAGATFYRIAIKPMVDMPRLDELDEFVK